MLNLLSEFFQQTISYREYIKQSVIRDLRRRYKRSVLGYLWSMLNPLLMMIVLTVVFSNIMKNDIKHYAVFLISGMLPFNFFCQTGISCLGSIRANSRIIDQLPIPKTIFPLAQAFSGLADYLLSLVPLLLVMLVCGHLPTLSFFALPLVLVPLFCVSLGVALVLAAANVFYEDVQHLTDVVFRALYFLCPIIYGRELLPDWLKATVVFNPLVPLIEAHRGLFYYGRWPSWWEISSSFVTSLLVLVFGLWVFRRSEDKFVYFL